MFIIVDFDCADFPYLGVVPFYCIHLQILLHCSIVSIAVPFYCTHLQILLYCSIVSVNGVILLLSSESLLLVTLQCNVYEDWLTCGSIAKRLCYCIDSKLCVLCVVAVALCSRGFLAANAFVYEVQYPWVEYFLFSEFYSLCFRAFVTTLTSEIDMAELSPFTTSKLDVYSWQGIWKKSIFYRLII